MDPPTLMNHGSFNLAEIWPFALNSSGTVSESNGNGLELRTNGSQFGQIWGQFSTANTDSNNNVNSESKDLLNEQQHSSVVVVKNGGVARKRRDGGLDDEGIMLVSTTSSVVNGNDVDENDGKRIKMPEDENHEAELEASSGKLAEQKTQQSEPPKQDYIHVRARRGQATDSHSLAERARREKISERMKILQDLVPGCNKVIGKALVLDEIINYIQSLQRQVEFLSMKLEAVNSRNPGLEGFLSKDFCQQTYESAGIQYGSQAETEYVRDSSPEWLHMQVGGGFERRT